ncbi:MAG: DNA polymerase, partial [Clostridia bacterium]|nr:DNA polymerase [Clostridia bacterium]
DGRIHSSFNQVETRTGRISSTEPNLQNIPIRSEAGRELRKFFIPAEGCVLIDADYSQIELRILAHIAGDEAMIEAFNRHDDIHTITASQVFRLPPEMVTPLLRTRAKAVNFGIVYGISAFSLAQDIGVTVREADSYIKNYLETFSGVRDYMRDVVAKAKENGYVETLLGRRRMLPELASSNHNLRSAGERIALNTPIQGTAADIIKIAMVRVHDRLKDEGLKARLILQVHDELIIEAPFGEAEAVRKVVGQEMEGAMSLRVRLEAEVHSGASWYDAK